MMYLSIIFSIIIIIYLMLILISFHPADPGWMQTNWREPIYNVGGVTGAKISDFLFFYFGSLSYVVPIFILFCIWRFFIKKTSIDVLIFFKKSILVMLCLSICCILAQLVFNDLFYFSSGGLVGNILFDFIKIYPYKIILHIFLILLCFIINNKIYSFNKGILYFLQILNKIMGYIVHTIYIFFFAYQKINFSI